MKILGISTLHDSSVCLIENGQLKKFFKEERLTRLKRDSDPRESIKAALENVDKIDILAYAPTAEVVGNYNDLYLWVDEIKKYSKIDRTINLAYDHHKVHASLAFYNSGFEEAAVIVVDGQGSVLSDYISEAESIFKASYPDNLIPIYKNFGNKWGFTQKNKIPKYDNCEVVCKSYLGIVMMYCSATVLIGEHPLDNGKTMGLAAYGEKNNFPNFLMNNNTIINHKMFTQPFPEIPEYKPNINKKINNVSKENYQFYANYAAHVQDQSELAMMALIKKTIEKTGLKNICITGGYGLNVVANSKYLKEFPGVNFYFEPIADDSGNSIGAAMLIYRQESKDMSINKMGHTFFHGKKYNIPDIGINFNIDLAIKILDKQKCLAIYYDLAEAGPRALGHRSILFDARNPSAKDIVNIVKKREWYRPFAAACLEEDAYKYFNIYNNPGYEFMTINAEANELAKQEIPGVLHVDGTCRIQIIKNKNEPLYKLLKKFKEKTGIGVLLNTSFNLAGEALVETPEDAINTFNNSELYCLWFPEINKAVIKN